MAKLTGRKYKESFIRAQQVTNSFYEEMPNDPKIRDEYITNVPVIDKETENLCAKNNITEVK